MPTLRRKAALYRKIVPPAFWLWLPVGLATGSAVALFMNALQEVTLLRQQLPWLLYLLPAAGLAMYLAYQRWGREAIRGNDLVIDEIHRPGRGVPVIMAPLVLSATLISHLFGASVGREGTAVQMGGSIAGAISQWFRVRARYAGLVLCCGMAAGFGAVFGTPLAGAVFSVEVLAIGSFAARRNNGQKIRHTFIACLLASYTGHFTCLAWGIRHVAYPLRFTWSRMYALQPMFWLAVVAVGIASGLAARLFVLAAHGLKKGLGKLPQKVQPGVPVVGGLLIIILVGLLGTRDYIGLGDECGPGGWVCLTRAFYAGAVPPYAWLLKMLFTIVSLGFGFKGGEVTPLFFTGACLGNAVASFTGEPSGLMAGLGFIAVFAGASNTPLACILMGIELFGFADAPLYTIACFLAYYCSGHKSIYSAQKTLHRKGEHLIRRFGRATKTH